MQVLPFLESRDSKVLHIYISRLSPPSVVHSHPMASPDTISFICLPYIYLLRSQKALRLHLRRSQHRHSLARIHRLSLFALRSATTRTVHAAGGRRLFECRQDEKFQTSQMRPSSSGWLFPTLWHASLSQRSQSLFLSFTGLIRRVNHSSKSRTRIGDIRLRRYFAIATSARSS